MTLAERIVALPAPVLAATGGFLVGVATFVLFRLRHPRAGRSGWGAAAAARRSRSPNRGPSWSTSTC